MRKSFQLQGREYEISKQDRLNDLRTRIENNMPLANRSNEQVIKDLPSDVKRYHFVIHEAYSNCEQRNIGYMKLTDMSLKISIIGKSGLIDDNYNHVIIIGSCIELMFAKTLGQKVKRFVYDGTENNPNSSWKRRVINVGSNNIMKESEDAAKNDSAQIMNFTMNNSNLNNQYSQGLSQTSYESVLSSGLINPQFMMNDYSNWNQNQMN